MGNLGGMEILVIFIVALIVLGPAKLPDAARQVGKAVTELRRVSSGFQRELRDAIEEPVAETKALIKEPLAETKALISDPVDGTPALSGPAPAKPARAEPVSAPAPADKGSGTGDDAAESASDS